MKPSRLLVAFACSLVALATTGQSQRTTPSPRPSASVANSPASMSSPASAKADDLAVPMESPAASTQAAAPSANNQPPPKPFLYLLGSEPFTANGKNWIRYRYDVANKMDYPADMFTAAPSLPPCGLNPNASRTWVDFFDSTGKRLYGFCALSNPADLGKIWFALEEGVIPPSYVYIELNDRQTNTKYKSNLADTTI